MLEDRFGSHPRAPPPTIRTMDRLARGGDQSEPGGSGPPCCNRETTRRAPWDDDGLRGCVSHTGRVILMRVQLPDRPGSLGLVTSALGQAQADISAVEIVERGEGYAIDDFMLSLPTGTPPDALITVCAALPGVDVMWVSTYPANWGITADTDVVDQMVAAPDDAEVILMEAAPAVFHCTWALIVEASGAVRSVTELGPEELAADPGSVRRREPAPLPVPRS